MATKPPKMPEEMLDAVNEAAADEDRSQNGWCVDVLGAALLARGIDWTREADVVPFRAPA